jgi:hypothetical protein
MVSVFDQSGISRLIVQGSSRTTFDHGRDRLGLGLVGLNPWLAASHEDFGSTVHAFLGVDAALRVVQHREGLAFVFLDFHADSFSSPADYCRKTSST